MGGNGAISISEARQDDLYREAADQYGPSIERLIRAYEADPDKRRDLSQDIHFQLWRSFERYDAPCSPRTWVYRVAHHVCVSHVMRERRIFSKLVSLEELETLPDDAAGKSSTDRKLNLDRLSALIQRLKPLDRQVIISYLEDLDAATIGEITGLSPGHVAMRIHRIKSILAKRFHEGANHADEFHDDPKTVWKNQSTEASTMTLDKIRQKARELRAKTRRELLSNIVVVLAAIAISGFSFAATHNAGLALCAALAIIWALAGQFFFHRGMWSATLPGDAALSSGFEFYRREVRRRSNLFHRLIQWSFGPVVLSVAILILVLTGIAKNQGLSGQQVIPFCTVFAVWIAGMFIQRSRAQRELRREERN